VTKGTASMKTIVQGLVCAPDMRETQGTVTTVELQIGIAWRP